MNTFPEKSLLLIDHAKDLAPLLDDLRNVKAVAVDTESNSLFAYFERVCLIQFSTPLADYLVDPLAISPEDIRKLAPCFQDPNIQKVFHAAEYDLIVLSRDFGFHFQNLFDTMWAACIVGKEEVGLGSLLQAEFNLNLDKRYQKADWGQRPLPGKMRQYAMQDTHYLLALRDKLVVELERCGRKSLAEEDFARFCKIDGNEKAGPTFTDNIAANVAQETARHRLNQTQAAVLEELYLYRDEIGRAQNRPPFKIIPERMLLILAQASPQETTDLISIPGINVRLARRYTDGLIKAIRRGVKKDTLTIKPPKYTPWRDEAYQARLRALKEWRKIMADKMGVKSDVVLARPLMEQIAYQSPSSLDELRIILQDSPWRLSNFGRGIMTVLEKNS